MIPSNSLEFLTYVGGKSLATIPRNGLEYLTSSKGMFKGDNSYQ